jgi:hypothetical protein
MAEGLQQFGAALTLAFQSFGSSTPATTFSVIGFGLLLIVAVLGFYAIRSEHRLPNGLGALLIFSLVAGVLFSLAGPGFTILTSKSKIPTVSREESFNRLKTNERVDWLIRLIAYDPAKDPGLEIGEIRSLGPPDHEFTWVGNYEELRGYSASEAARMAGLITGPRKHVSAIIFQLVGDLYPANTRGLLQIIRLLESEHHEELTNNLSLDLQKELNPEELTNLDDKVIHSYAWDNYRRYYSHFCRVTQKFRNAKYYIKKYIGEKAYAFVSGEINIL